MRAIQKKIFHSEAANRTPPTLPSPSPPQAHDMVDVWQWRAIGNNHDNNRKITAKWLWRRDA